MDLPCLFISFWEESGRNLWSHVVSHTLADVDRLIQVFCMALPEKKWSCAANTVVLPIGGFTKLLKEYSEILDSQRCDSSGLHIDLRLLKTTHISPWNIILLSHCSHYIPLKSQVYHSIPRFFLGVTKSCLIHLDVTWIAAESCCRWSRTGRALSHQLSFNVAVFITFVWRNTHHAQNKEGSWIIPSQTHTKKKTYGIC